MSPRTPISVRRFSIKLLATFALLSVFFAFNPQSSVQAVTLIPKSKISCKTKARTTSNGGANQGGVVTSKYYVYLDCSSNHCASKATAVFIDRQTSKIVKRRVISAQYLSGLSYEWGADYISVISNGRRVGCLPLNGGKYITDRSKCYQPKNVTQTTGGSSQGTSANYKGYIYRISGKKNSGSAYIGVYNKKNKKLQQMYKINTKFEPEGISIDGATGAVYIVCNGGGHSVVICKIDASVFSKYTKQSGGSSGNSSNDKSEGNGSGETINDYYEQPEPPGFDGTIETNLFGTIKDNGDGCGTYEVMNLVIEILSIGIGITGVIGIVISGIEYLTSKENVEKITKAKRRILMIVVGLALYVVLWSLLSFLLPGGAFNTSNTCERVDTTTTET